MNPYLSLILERMCQFANVRFKDIDFKSPDWFLKYEWTKNQEAEFKIWLIDFLRDNKQARISIMKTPKHSKKILEKVANEFIFNYGWKVV
jgi:hypothetical protein